MDFLRCWINFKILPKRISLRKLPDGHSHRGHKTHSRSFAGPGESIGGRAQLSEAQAVSQVVAWLWEWRGKSDADVPSGKRVKK